MQLSESDKAVLKILLIAGAAYGIYVLCYPDKGSPAIIEDKSKKIEGTLQTNP